MRSPPSRHSSAHRVDQDRRAINPASCPHTTVTCGQLPPPSLSRTTQMTPATCKQVICRPPRCTIVSADSSESRPCRCAVAYASLDTSAAAKGRQLRGGRGTARARGGCGPSQSRDREPLTSLSQTGGTAPDPALCTGHPADPDLRIRTPAYWPGPWHQCGPPCPMVCGPIGVPGPACKTAAISIVAAGGRYLA